MPQTRTSLLSSFLEPTISNDPARLVEARALAPENSARVRSIFLEVHLERRTLLAALPTLLLLLAVAPSLRADRANGDPRLEKLYGQFIAPCCWAENLLVHSAPIADQMRAEIKRMAAAGKTDEEIKAVYIERYTIRILSMPEGVRGQWLSWTPIAAIVAGLAATILAIRRFRQVPPAQSTAQVESADDIEWDWDSEPQTHAPPTRK